MGATAIGGWSDAYGSRRKKWGSNYDNRNKVLPSKDKNGNNITYKEYDIPNMRDGLGAGIDRIVVGSDGRRYYTGTHYDGFGRIK
ncbi:ribonuclease domain-containing protein [Psychrobacter sanguinis]|uniref:ribonuclease domain-containing protein n=1 Tax=Psychrobacter sanguinis TaxID=861445 RepID=UPI0035E3D698